MKSSSFAWLCVALLATTAETKAEKLDTLKTYELQNVQVTATRAQHNTPMTFSNLTQQELAKHNHGQDIPSLLSFMPSVTFTSDAGNGIGYTALKVRGTDPSRINFTANGIPLNDAESSQVFFVNMGDFISNVKDLQIQRGVGTSTNGSAAFGATVNLQTDAPSLKPFVTLSTAAGSYASHKETLLFGSGLLQNHWSFNVRLSNIGSHGYIDRATSSLNSYFLQGAYSSRSTLVKWLTFNGTERTYMAWDYASLAQMAQYGRRYNPAGEYTDANGQTQYYPNQTDNYHQQNYQLIWNQLVSPAFNFNIALHYTAGNGFYEQYKAQQKLKKYGFPPTSPIADLIRRKHLSNDFYGWVYALNYQHARWNATLGGANNRYSGRHFGKILAIINAAVPYSLLQEYYRNKAEKTENSVYAKANVELVKGLSIYADLQYRNINYRLQDPNDNPTTTANAPWRYNEHYHFFNPKAGLFFQPSEAHAFYLSWAVSHREPTRNDFEGTLRQLPRAERMTDWEAGYKLALPRLTMGINLYSMHYKDQFVLTGEINSTGEMIHRNVGTSYREGIEWQASWQPLNWFKWQANATFSRNRAKDWMVESNAGRPLRFGTTHLSFSPDVLANQIITFTHGGFEAMVRNQFVSRQHMTNDNNTNLMLPSYFLTHLDANYSFHLPSIRRITAGITIYNLFNKKYFSNGYASAEYDNMGREVSSSAVYSAQATAHFMTYLTITL